MTPIRTPANPVRGYAVWAGWWLAGAVLIVGLGSLLWQLVRVAGGVL